MQSIYASLQRTLAAVSYVFMLCLGMRASVQMWLMQYLHKCVLYANFSSQLTVLGKTDVWNRRICMLL